MPEWIIQINDILTRLNLISTAFRILLAMVCGGVIGLEREKANQAAGMRTYMLVCMGASVVMLTGQYMYETFQAGDPARLGAQVISGIGFLGAGSIIIAGGKRVKGLTTAAGLWVAGCIGLAIGMAVNTLIFPYDNSRSIRRTMEGLDRDLVAFLEDMFDGDDHLPEADALEKKIDALEGQLVLFGEQRLFRRRRQRRLLRQLSGCADIAQELLVELETLRNMERQGRLDLANRQALRALGAQVREEPPAGPERPEDVVVNYHVARALELRRELKRALKQEA